MSPRPDVPGIVLTDEQLRRRRRRNVALALTLFALIVLFYAITIFKISAGVPQGPA
jgi:hypothetical protein